jgi:DNA repair exonuclease SbcCD ATPase subunit
VATYNVCPTSLSHTYHLISESTSASAGGQSNIAEENSKLREALRRLHTQSTTDKSKLEMLMDKCENDEQELITLREYQEHTAAEVLELREIVDSAASYEAMIESLTERNLELSQSAQQLESTVR